MMVLNLIQAVANCALGIAYLYHFRDTETSKRAEKVYLTVYNIIITLMLMANISNTLVAFQYLQSALMLWSVPKYNLMVNVL
jgi:hypothetical protein